MQTFYRLNLNEVFREQSAGAATRLLQRKKLCQSTIFFANGAAIACLPFQPRRSNSTLTSICNTLVNCSGSSTTISH
jgi:hypothetical protein